LFDLKKFQVYSTHTRGDESPYIGGDIYDYATLPTHVGMNRIDNHTNIVGMVGSVFFFVKN
ncbi:MAG: hypothetical protein R3Y46_08300, partial [Opitutales bacterium]